jgi:RecA-family ATPase
MDKLAPKLIRRASKKNYIAIVIDPIYKVITGDENSADQMANFCNQFDKVCTELGCAVIYCHHHSKGSQGGKKSMDRASGSGVFARDPDALLDLIELPVTDALLQQQADKAVCEICQKWLKRFGKEDEASPDDLCSDNAMLGICKKSLAPASYSRMLEEIKPITDRIKKRTAWRIEGTLREFPKFDPINLWFEFPAHTIDSDGVLADVETEEMNSKGSPWKKNFSRKKSPEDRAKERSRGVEEAFSYCSDNGKAEISDLAQYMGASEKTVRRRLKEHGGYWIDEGLAGEK